MAGRLTIKDLRVVRNAVYDVAAKWYDLGLELGIAPDYLDTIKHAHSEPQGCLREMLRKWLSGVNPEPSWKVLCDALRNEAVGFQYLAEKILKEKCTMQSQEDSSQFSEDIEQADSVISFSQTLGRGVVGSRSDSDLKSKQGSSLPTFLTQKECEYHGSQDADDRKKAKGEISYSDQADTNSSMRLYHRRNTAGETDIIHGLRGTSLPRDPPRRNRSKSVSSQNCSQSTMSYYYTEQYNGCKYRFVTKPASELYCQECEEISCEPHQMQCKNCSKSSLFCKACVPTVCPTCKNISESFPDGLTKDRIQKLKITCPNDIQIHWLQGGLRCSWEGELQTVAQHHLVCPRELLVCPYEAIGCEKMVCREELTKHEEDHREGHVDLTMKQVVSIVKTITNLKATIKELKERLEHQECIVNNLKEELSKVKS